MAMNNSYLHFYPLNMMIGVQLKLHMEKWVDKIQFFISWLQVLSNYSSGIDSFQKPTSWFSSIFFSPCYNHLNNNFNICLSHTLIYLSEGSLLHYYSFHICGNNGCTCPIFNILYRTINFYFCIVFWFLMRAF